MTMTMDMDADEPDPLDLMKAMALKETAAARRIWRGLAPCQKMAPAETGGVHRLSANSIAGRVQKMCGKGMTAEQVAEAIGCHINSVRNALRKHGWKL